MDIGIPEETLKQLLYTCTYNIQFLFNGHIFRQKDGVAMGSPLGPLLADVFMSTVEDSGLKSIVHGCKLYKRYVDDIFCIIDKEKSHVDLLRVANAAHPNVKFTCELEENDKLAFLDVLLIRRVDNTLSRRVHHKATWSGQYTHFQSYVPLQRKRNLVRTITSRTRKICSEDTVEIELSKVRGTFKENGYPERFLDIHMSEVNQQREPTAGKKAIYLNLPYKGEVLATTMSRRLYSAVQRAFYAAKLILHFNSTKLLQTTLKDALPSHASSFCVYSFTCSCGASYIGRTTRCLSERVKEHHPIWFTKGECRPTSSSVLSHLLDSGHRIQTHSAFQPIYKVSGKMNRQVKQRLLATAEAIGIRLYNPALCAQKFITHPLVLPWPIVNRTGDTCKHVNTHMLMTNIEPVSVSTDI